MDKFERNYEKIRSQLLGNAKIESFELWIKAKVEELGLSVREINEVIESMRSDNEIVVIDDVAYVCDNQRFKVGKLRVVRGSFGFVGSGDDSIYVGSDQFKNALDQDEVLIEIKHGTKISGEVIAVLKRTKEYILGTTRKEKGQLIFEAYDGKIGNRIDFDTKGQEVAEGTRLVARILSVDKGIVKAELASVLGMADEPGMDVLSVLYVNDLETEFTEEALIEARAKPDTISPKDIEGRIDHRKQHVITIDGEDAKDLDDAIYMESLNQGYRLYVHIADVSHYVTENSALDKDAYDRSSSIYMVDRVVPMLPPELSNGICSLHPDVDRLTLTCKMDIDYSGSIYNYEIYPSVIQSKRRYSYNQVNQRKDLGEAEHMIEMMFDCASRLQYRREEAGSIGFDSDESQFIVDSNGDILDIFRRETGEAEAMIEAFMVSANESVAKHCRYQELPILYRVHEKPDKDKMQALSHTLRILGYKMRGSLDDVHPNTLQKALKYFEDKPEAPVVSRLMLRSMSKARYAPEPLGHFGLALEDYAHFTSPIRRYPDLILHQRLRQYLFNSDYSRYKEHEAFASKAAEHVSRKERDIMDAERQVEKIKKSQFMEDKIGLIEMGYISGVSNYGIFVELPNTVEGVIPLKSLNDDYYTFDTVAQKLIGERSKREYIIGQKVKIKVDSVNKAEYEVNFKLIDKPRKRVKRNGFKRRQKP